MTQKQIRNIFLSVGFIAVGVTAFGMRRKKNYAFDLVQDEIQKIGPQLNPNSDATSGIGGSTIGCNLSNKQIENAVDSLESSMYGNWWQLGFGTKEQKMINTIEGIGCVPCFNAVKAKYNQETGRFLVIDLRDEVSGDELTKLNLKIAQLTAQCG